VVTPRVLVGPVTSDLADLYAVPSSHSPDAGPWLRVNMVSTVDGAAAGETGRTGAINNEVDKRVFHHLRAQADVIVVGAGTARTEAYRPAVKPIVLVSRSGAIPVSLRDAPAGSVLMATVASAPELTATRAALGDSCVLMLGETEVSLPDLKAALGERGWRDVLCEGGPSLLRDLVAAGMVDELCSTVVPRLIAGAQPRITIGDPIDAPLRLHTLAEHDGTLLARWLVG